MDQPSESGICTGISIVIAARNEATNLPHLFESIKNQIPISVPFELIVVNDASEDSTRMLLEKSTLQFPWLKIVTQPYSLGKRIALNKGIEESRFSFIAITDADCRPGKGWLEALLKNFNLGYDVIFGMAYSEITSNYVSKIGSYENFRGTLLLLVAAYLKIPYSARAANFGFRKDSFYSIGGYHATNDSASGDDDLLIREAFKAKMNIHYFLEKDSFVLYFQKSRITDYLKQKARHTGSSHHYLFLHQFLLSYWHAMNIFAQWAIIFWPVSVWFAWLTLIKTLFDVVVTSLFGKKCGYKFRIIDKFVLPFIYEFFIEVNFIYSFFRKSKW
ncbi:MAG: glycosyltransferase [Ignavibacteriaceae bacterium]|nr:glycosyltransferase [Ignavibacteriaceae bacterium]